MILAPVTQQPASHKNIRYPNVPLVSFNTQSLKEGLQSKEKKTKDKDDEQLQIISTNH